MSDIVSYEQLSNHFGSSSPAQLAIKLHNAGVKFFSGKRNRPFTTVTALNHALKVIPSKGFTDDVSPEKYEIEFL